MPSDHSPEGNTEPGNAPALLRSGQRNASGQCSSVMVGSGGGVVPDAREARNW